MDKYVKDSDIYDIVMSQFCASSDETEAALNAIIEGTRALPPADVRPVVLCRDCKHGQGEKMDFWNEYEGIECIGGVVHRKDWFCADGKKREKA